MSKLKKIVLTAAALGALAVGGAAFAQAQNGPITPASVQPSGSQAGTTDTDPGQSVDTGTDPGEGGAEQASEAPDTHESHDAIGGHEVEDGN
jgi:ABC-type transport system substrate-binding protein